MIYFSFFYNPRLTLSEVKNSEIKLEGLKLKSHLKMSDSPVTEKRTPFILENSDTNDNHKEHPVRKQQRT